MMEERLYITDKEIIENTYIHEYIYIDRYRYIPIVGNDLHSQC